MNRRNNQSLLVIKPDAIERREAGGILKLIEEKDFKISKIREKKISKEIAEFFYKEHQGKVFFDELTDFISKSSIIAIILEKENAIEELRKIIGNNDPELAEEGTIRNKYGKNKLENSVHASDSLESFEREKKIFFSEKKINNYNYASSNFSNSIYKSFIHSISSSFSLLMYLLPIILIISVIASSSSKLINNVNNHRLFAIIFISLIIILFLLLTFESLIIAFWKKLKKTNRQ